MTVVTFDTLKSDILKLIAEIRLLKWMAGATFAAVMTVLIRLFLSIPH